MTTLPRKTRSTQKESFNRLPRDKGELKLQDRFSIDIRTIKLETSCSRLGYQIIIYLLERTIEFPRRYVVNTETRRPKDFQRFTSPNYSFDKHLVSPNSESNDIKGIISKTNWNDKFESINEMESTNKATTEKISATLQRYL